MLCPDASIPDIAGRPTVFKDRCMTENVREWSPDSGRRSRPQGTPVNQDPDVVATDLATILRLQRLVGNQAVLRALTQHQNGASGPEPEAQRLPNNDPGAVDSTNGPRPTIALQRAGADDELTPPELRPADEMDFLEKLSLTLNGAHWGLGASDVFLPALEDVGLVGTAEVGLIVAAAVVDALEFVKMVGEGDAKNKASVVQLGLECGLIASGVMFDSHSTSPTVQEVTAAQLIATSSYGYYLARALACVRYPVLTEEECRKLFDAGIDKAVTIVNDIVQAYPGYKARIDALEKTWEGVHEHRPTLSAAPRN